MDGSSHRVTTYAGGRCDWDWRRSPPEDEDWSARAEALHDADLARQAALEEEEPPPRDRSHESAQHVLDAVVAWLEAHGSPIRRTHPQELMAAHTPIGPAVRIAVQAARTPVESTVAGMIRRVKQHPTWAGMPIAVALPDLPRLRAAAEKAARDAPHFAVTWLFVHRCGAVAAVPPPQEDPGAAEPASAVA